MGTPLILLLAWLFGLLMTIGLGLWRDVQFAWWKIKPLYLRAWLYRILPLLVAWPLYLILVAQDLYVLHQAKRKLRERTSR